MFTNEQRLKYEATRQMAEEELERFDRLLAEEVQRTKQKIEELQQAKRSVKQIYDSVCALLGVKSAVEMKDYGIDLERRA